MERWEQPRVGESRGRKESQTTSVDPAFLVYQDEESKEQLLFYLGNPAASGTKLKTKAAPQSLPKPFLTAQPPRAQDPHLFQSEYKRTKTGDPKITDC